MAILRESCSLALSYNYISVLPPAFAKLGGTLRYLNIRLNMLTTFPPVVGWNTDHFPGCLAVRLHAENCFSTPALRDAVARDPRHQPQQDQTAAVQLRYPARAARLFDIQKPRQTLTVLYCRYAVPSSAKDRSCGCLHICDALCLRLLIEAYPLLFMLQNPLEWPPREIVTQPNIPANNQSGGRKESDAAARLDEAQALQRWLTNLQEWIREHSSKLGPTIRRPEKCWKHATDCGSGTSC